MEIIDSKDKKFFIVRSLKHHTTFAVCKTMDAAKTKLEEALIEKQKIEDAQKRIASQIKQDWS